jgi:hypothetical protein
VATEENALTLETVNLGNKRCTSDFETYDEWWANLDPTAA